MHKFYFVASSHLDREWYQTYEQFRMHIADIFFRVFELLEKSDSFTIFMVDGQVSVVEDFLEIYPKQKERIHALVRGGKLLLGPWYTQPDELLVDGESHIRNLEIGMELARKMGHSMQIGYLPDSFGHIAQMPQILNGFGFDKAFLMRGVEKNQGQEFIWEAPDGSCVKTIQNLYGNCNITITPDTKEHGTGILQTADEIKKRLIEFDQSMACPTLSERKLVTYCNDHSAPSEEFDTIFHQLKNDGFDIYIGSLEDYYNTIPWENISLRLRGELREGEDIPLLRETAVSRSYLKRENYIAQKKLIHQAEPAAALAQLCGKAQPNAFLRYAWKLLLQNHGHDSICGCSINAVHDEMMMRYRKLEQVADRHIQKSAVNLMDSFVVPSNEQDSAILMILNTSCASCDYAEGNVTWPDYKKYQSFKLYDASGMEVPYQILDSVEECHIDSDINIVQRFCRMVGYHILLPVSGIPKCGFVAYRIRFSAEPALEQSKQQGIPKLENDYLRVSFHTNGTFSVEDKLSGKNYSQLHYFLDDGTNGDVYAYHQVPGDTPFDSRNLKWEVRQKDDGPLMQSVVLQTKMLLPMRMEESGKRSSELVGNDLSYCISLKKHSRQLEIHLSLKNQAQDHRLRLMIPTYTNSETAVADAPFYHENRATDQFPYYHPMHTFVQVHSADTGIAFLSRGISQFQLKKDKDNTLGITLHHGRSRLYAWLDWRDPRFDGIQCLGKNEYDYALAFYEGEREASQIHDYAQAYNYEPLVFQRTTSTFKDTWRWGAIEIQEGNVQVSALRSINDCCIELRIYNPMNEETTAKLSFGFTAKAIREVTMEGETIKEHVFSSELFLNLQPAKISTIRFDLV